MRQIEALQVENIDAQMLQCTIRDAFAEAEIKRVQIVEVRIQIFNPCVCYITRGHDELIQMRHLVDILEAVIGHVDAEGQVQVPQ